MYVRGAQGLYKEAEHDQLDAARNLLTAQLNHLLRNRPGFDAVTAKHPQLMEANELAMAFEDRAVGTANAAAAGGSDDGSAAAQASSSLLTLSYASLKSWPALEELMNSTPEKDLMVSVNSNSSVSIAVCVHVLLNDSMCEHSASLLSCGMSY